MIHFEARAPRAGAELLQRLLRAGLSRYEPDPLQAIAEAEQRQIFCQIPLDARRL